MRYFLVVGEASADGHAARLITELRHLDARAEFAFIGGDAMARAAGCPPLYHCRRLAVMGVADVVRSHRQIGAAARALKQGLTQFKPQVVIPVDYGGFNLRYTLPLARRADVPVVYYIPPKVWAFAHARVRALRAYTRLCLVILPFEADYLLRHGVQAQYIGSPTTEAVAPYLNAYSPRPDGGYIALLPGSRPAEIRRNLPAMLQAVRLLPRAYPVRIAGAPGAETSLYLPILQREGYPREVLQFGRTAHLLAHAQAAVVTSGTANLEAALIGTPQVVCYRTQLGTAARLFFKHIVPVKYFSPVNLVADAPVVTELLGDAASPKQLAHALEPLLDPASAPHRAVRQGYQAVQARLEPTAHPHPSREAARQITLLLGLSPQANP